MAYEPLHHKYRPQTFAELVGQEAIAITLSQAMHQQRIAPAYLFTGARGTGKTSTARIMAKSLNCLQSATPTSIPCGECEMCRSITRGIALDITEIDAASNTGVDNIREIIERAQFAPVKARYKVYVIDECHMLSNAAFNALLKTLEEPPDRVVFILATTDPQRVLPTIISRCQRFDFRRIPLESMVQHLTHIAEIEKILITAEAVTLVAQIAQGGLRDAESLLDQLSLWEGTITPSMVWDLVGAVPEQDLLLLLEKILQKDTVGLLEKTRQILDRGRESLAVLQSMAGLYRDLLIAQNAPQRKDLVAWTTEGWQQLVELSRSFVLSNILAGQQYLRSAEVQIKNTTQPRLWLEVTLLGLLELPPPSSAQSEPIAGKQQVPASVPQQSFGQREEIPLKKQEPIPTPSQREHYPSVPQPEIIPTSSTDPAHQSQIVSTPVSSPSLATITISDRDAEATWQDILSQLTPASRAVFSAHAKCLGITSNQIRIGLKSKGIYKIAEEKKKEIGVVCEKYFKRSVQVSLEVIAAKKPPPETVVASPLPQEINQPTTKEQTTAKTSITSPIAASAAPVPIAPRQFVQHDQAIQNILQIFGGEVIDLDQEPESHF